MDATGDRLAIFEVDSDTGEATGTVYHFCDEPCRAAFALSRLTGTPYNYGHSDGYVDQSQCDHCGAAL